jgi:hypothetical protein
MVELPIEFDHLSLPYFEIVASRECITRTQITLFLLMMEVVGFYCFDKFDGIYIAL